MNNRADFENWYENEFMSGLDGPGEFDEERGCYASFQVHMAWNAWRASRRLAFNEVDSWLRDYTSDHFDGHVIVNRIYDLM